MEALTGVPASTLRTWERRYGAVVPLRRPGGGRRFAPVDVQRIELMRRLTEKGETIADIAKLGVDALGRRARAHGLAIDAEAPTNSVPRIALVHPTLGTRYEQLRERSASIAVAVRTEAELREAAPPRIYADVLIVDLSALVEPTAASLRRCLDAVATPEVWLTYDFAPARVLDELRLVTTRLLQGSPSAMTLDRWVKSRAPAAAPAPATPECEEIAPRRFDDETLARLRDIESELSCECPNHLATLVASLVAFERYCQQCEDDEPEQARVHRRLHVGTAAARRSMETLLELACEQDEIVI